MDDRRTQIEKRLTAMEQEKQSLLEELSSLAADHVKPLFGKPVMPYPPSTTEEKISLFLTLFGSRTDVFPKLWENVKKHSKGYSPACGNEWIEGVCLKPRAKCSDCRNKYFLPMDHTTVKSHLLGRMTIGVYSIRQDDSCIFLADGPLAYNSAFHYQNRATNVRQKQYPVIFGKRFAPAAGPRSASSRLR